MMEYVILANGVRMPLVGLGTYPLRGMELQRIVQITNSLGYQLYDTAYLYRNEKDLGAALRDEGIDRRHLFITSKLSGYQVIGHKYLLRLDRMSVERAFNGTCKRLKTNYLDLYLLHSPFRGYTEAYKKLIKLHGEQKVKAIGVCNCGIEHLRKLKMECGVFPMVNQVEMHPYHSRRDIVDFCVDNGIQVEAYSPFAHGDALTELIKDKDLTAMAYRYHKSVPQIILRWLVQRGIVVVPRSTKSQHLKECIDIFDFNLTETEIEKINSLDKGQSYGVRSSK